MQELFVQVLHTICITSLGAFKVCSDFMILSELVKLWEEIETVI